MRPFVVCIPRLNEIELLDETLESMRASTIHPEKLVLVDNGDEPLPVVPVGPWSLHLMRPPRITDRGFDVQSAGVAASWNFAFRGTSLPVILLNSDCAVAPTTFSEMMADPTPVVSAYGFACVRIDHDVWCDVGPFDEAFYPAYYEDADYCHRLDLHGWKISEWDVEPRVEVSPGRTRSVQGITHGKEKPCWSGEKLAWFHARIEENRLRYIAKWGGMPDHERFVEPFDGKQEDRKTGRQAERGEA